MLAKAVFLFLAFIAVLGIFGKLRVWPNKTAQKLPRPTKCAECGTPIIGKGPCPCTRPPDVG